MPANNRIIFRRNKLQYIPEDFFRDLKLDALYLDENNIKLLVSQVDRIIAADSLKQVSGKTYITFRSNLD